MKDPTLGILDDPGFIEVLVDRLEHMILPALTLGLVIFGEYTLIVRSAMLETLGEDYILTSTGKGALELVDGLEARVPQRPAPRDHARRALPRVHHRRSDHRRVRLLVPGDRLLIVEAIDQRDYPVLQAAFLLLTLSVILFNLLADLLYFRLDPRVTE